MIFIFKRAHFLIIFLIFFSINAFSFSLTSAHKISEAYLESGESINTYFQPPISCDSENFFVIPIFNSLGEPMVFLPFNIKQNEIYLSRSEAFDVKLIKTEYLLMLLSSYDQDNYLSLSFIDGLNNIIYSLNETKAKLEGFSKNKYSQATMLSFTQAINDIKALISLLNQLKENSSELLVSQNSFLRNPSCKQSEELLLSFSNAFADNNLLLAKTSSYIDSTNLLKTNLTSDPTIQSNELPILLNYTSSPITNSSISSLNLSSTNNFYKEIYDLLYGSKGNSTIKLYVDNLYLRKDLTELNTKLYSYDSSFKNYQNLDSVVNTILDENNKFLWNEQEQVSELTKIYSEINMHKSKAEYSKALSKFSLLREKSLLILEAGITQEPEKIDYSFYYVLLGFLVLALIVFIFIKRKSKLSKNIKPKKKDFNF